MSDDVLDSQSQQIEPIVSEKSIQAPLTQPTRKAILEYHHIVQKPSLCGPTSLQMILERHGVRLDQEEIAKEIGVKVAADEVGAFSIPLPVGEDPKELGMDLEAFGGFQVKEFFAKHTIQLEPKVYRLSQINDLGKLIYEHLQQGNDVMVDIWMAHYKEDLPMGHYSLVTAIDGDTITLCDPWPTTDAFWKTSLQELEKSMDSSHDGQERGLVVFIKK